MARSHAPRIVFLVGLIVAFGACTDSNAPPADTQTPDTQTPDTTTPDAAPDDGEDDTSPDTVSDTVDTSGPEVVAPYAAYTLELGGWTMQPGEETTRCIITRLGNAERIFVPRIRTNLARGSHHFVIYRASDQVERKEPFECTPFSETLGGQTVPLMITQTREETLALPPDVAFELEADQMIRLEAHYLNYYTEPITAEAVITFEALPPDATPLVADFLFYGMTSFFIPEGQSVTTNWRYYPVPDGLQVFALTGHTHALGTNVEVEVASNASSSTEVVYPPPGEPFKWSEAPVAFFDPPLSFSTGEGFRFRCSWTNTTDSGVGFGESARSEMCFFWAYYFPSRGFISRF